MNLKNLFILPSTYYTLYRDVRRQKRYVQKVIEPIIAEAILNNDGTLDTDDFEKIRKYYAFGVPAIVGEGICTLRGWSMNERERKASTFQGALTGLYDDFFDKTHIRSAEIKKMMADPEGFDASTSLENLFIKFLIKVHDNLYHKKFFNNRFDQVYNAQTESRKQVSDELSFEALQEITFRKGGHSLLFYRSIFEHDLREGEEEALYHAGALMQLGNDIFDVYEDERQQIKTLLTSTKEIEQVRQLFNGQLDKTVSLFRDTAFKPKNIERYLRKFVLGISRCFVCLDQLEKLQEMTGGQFSPSKYSRNELICDMEKPGNIVRSLRWFTAYQF